MQEKNRIIADFNFTENLKMLAEVYEEISIMRIQRTKTSVLKTREFLADLSEVFANVKNAYRTQLLELLGKKKTKNAPLPTALTKNGKEVEVFLSANTKLYGDIIPKIFNLFFARASTGKGDLVICGKLGKDMFKEKQLNIPYTYFDVPDSDINFEDLKPLISHIVNYQKIHVYYGKFVNIVNQVPVYSDISGEEPFTKEEQKATTGKDNLGTDNKIEVKKFFFEPSAEKIFDFFQTQIFTSLFKQTIYESTLSRYASRINAMEEALGNINIRVGELKNQQRKVKRAIQNKKQIETLSGIAFWGA